MKMNHMDNRGLSHGWSFIDIITDLYSHSLLYMLRVFFARLLHLHLYRRRLKVVLHFSIWIILGKKYASLYWFHYAALCETRNVLYLKTKGALQERSVKCVVS